MTDSTVSKAMIMYLIVVIFGAIGWIGNIVQIAIADNFELSGVMILKIVGIFAPPLGAVMGWVGLFF